MKLWAPDEHDKIGKFNYKLFKDINLRLNI